MGGPGLRREAALLRAAGGADEFDPFGLRPLAGDEADASGGRVEEDAFAPRHRSDAVEEVFDRHALQHRGGGVLEGDAVGQRADLRGGHHARLGIGAGRRHGGVGGAVAFLEVGDAGADGLDHARRFHAERVGHGEL